MSHPAFPICPVNRLTLDIIVGWLDYLLSLSLPSDIDDIAEERYIHAMTGRLFILSMARKAPHDSPLAIVICMCQIE